MGPMTRHQDFNDLIQSANDGDSEALGELMHGFTPLIRGVIGNVYRETSLLDVDESVSDLWSKAWRQLGSFRGHEEPTQCQSLFAGWISRTARNFALDELTKARALKRGGAYQRAEFAGDDVAADGKTPSSIVKNLSQANRLREEIEKLDALPGEVIRLRFYEGMTVAAIAELTYMTTDKVRTLIERTMELLKQQVPE